MSRSSKQDVIERETSCCETCGEALVSLLGSEACVRCLSQDLHPLVLGKAPTTSSGLEGQFPELTEIEWVNAGGMSNVYRAIESPYDRPVILKISTRSTPLDLQMTQCPGAEVQALAGLHHSNILHLYRGGLTDDGNPYVITELVEGETLAECLKREGTVSEQDVIPIVRQLCDALAYAHRRKICHRDLKPSNVMIGNDGTVRVIDFGLAEIAGWGMEGALGTAYYVAPEQRRGEPTDERVDVFGLGILIHEMLTGDVPSPGSPMRPSRHPGVDRRWDRLLQQAVEEHREDRYASVSLLWDAIEQTFLGTTSSMLQRVGMGLLALCGLTGAVVAGAHWMEKNHPSKDSSKDWPNPVNASATHPWQNSLGMPFVPVPGTSVLMCAYETRVGDYRSFSRKSGHESVVGKGPPTHFLHEDGWESAEQMNWADPGFPQSDAHPVCGVSWYDAEAFCRWLTRLEQQEGRLKSRQRYRLPTDEEWSYAAGLTEEQGHTPKERFNRTRVHTFPWGSEWRPPPTFFGNYASVEARNHRWPIGWNVIPGYEDGYARTAPVGSYQANEFGIYDLSGNVWEWCEDWWADDVRHKVLRGGAWMTSVHQNLNRHYRDRDLPENRYDHRGFRVVLTARR